MTPYFVAETEDIPVGEHRVFEVAGRSIGIYNVKGDYFAYLNYCPHQGAELCRGPVCGTSLPSNVYEYMYGREGEIVRCPWHGWEFDLKTGRSLVKEHVRLRKFPLVIEDGRIGVVLK
ncbi:Rieske (2Fe-2S) protein [Paenibacillus koleovorans]|uniref:Rieske (2Fe-2S) protein n=1 Tax=Paenibacillus koleovorans TaxID=121608 RepID=UPI000FDC28B9|nr:Rieske (2Fe-2S) protein [Paenibacillus koleovorans]